MLVSGPQRTCNMPASCSAGDPMQKCSARDRCDSYSIHSQSHRQISWTNWYAGVVVGVRSLRPKGILMENTDPRGQSVFSLALTVQKLVQNQQHVSCCQEYMGHVTNVEHCCNLLLTGRRTRTARLNPPLELERAWLCNFASAYRAKQGHLGLNH